MLWDLTYGPSGLADQQGTQLRQSLRRNNHLVPGQVPQDPGSLCPALRPVHPFSVGKNVCVERNPHRSALIQLVAGPSTDIDRVLPGKTLQQRGFSGLAGRAGIVAGNNPRDRLAMRGHHVRMPVPDLPQKAREAAVRFGSRNGLVHHGTLM
jgi:hypothetical protein